MLCGDLKEIIESIGVSQADLARLMGVTPRAVSLWLVGDRAIPGPVEAYARLLQSVTPAQRQAELLRLRERKTAMRDGLYGVEYQGGAGAGAGVLIVDGGRVYGADPYGGKYDGEYTYDEGSGLAELRLKLTFAPNTRSVFGVSHPHEWSVDATTQFNPRADAGQLTIRTAIGPQIQAQYRYLRAIPEN